MRLDIGTEFVTAKKNVAAEESIAFAFEVEIIRQPRGLVAVFFHPARKMRRFARALFVPEITGNEFATNREPRIGCENHIRKSTLRGDQMNLATQFRKRRVQFVPLLLCKGGLGAAGTAHPGIDLVFDSVIVRRTKEQLADKSDNLLAATFGGVRGLGFGDAIGEVGEERCHSWDQAD